MDLTGLTQKLRKEPTESEREFWRHIRAKQLNGLRFRRQQRIGNYIVDFYCAEKKLAIELDGGQHAQSVKDKERDAFIESKGISIVRIWNNEIAINIEGVLEYIKKLLEDRVGTYRHFKKKIYDKAVRCG